MGNTTQMYLSAGEIAGVLKMSISYSYTIIAQMNEELKQMGMYTIPGKVPTKFFQEKFYGVAVTDELLQQINQLEGMKMQKPLENVM